MYCNTTYKNKQKLCRYIVLGVVPTLLGMLDIETINILSVKCNTVELRSHAQECRG